MQIIHKALIYIWLIATILIILMVSYKCYTEGYKKWYFYYGFAIVTFLMYLLRKYMYNRMLKHMEYLEDLKKNGK
jgi:hypothetical protein